MGEVSAVIGEHVAQPVAPTVRQTCRATQSEEAWAWMTLLKGAGTSAKDMVVIRQARVLPLGNRPPVFLQRALRLKGPANGNPSSG
jgi:hypothetical protein